MVTVIRRELGKQKLISALPFSLAAAVAIFIASNAGQASLMAALGVTVAVLLFCEFVAYFAGYFNQHLVIHYVKMVKQEQEKVQAASAKYEKQLSKDLTLVKTDPWDFYRRHMQQRLNEVYEKHEAATGDRSTDLKLSRMARDLNDDLSLIFQVKEAGATLSADEMRSIADQIQHTLDWNKNYAASSKKTMDEANEWLAKVKK